MAKHRDTHDKTNAIRAVEQAGVPFETRMFECPEALSGVDVANLLGLEKERVFKTLVTQGKSGDHYVFMIPVAEELDFKKRPAAVGEKAIAMIKSKELLPLTGYIHGGCSPVGMKKLFTTTVDETAVLFDRIVFSGGRLGCQIEMSVDDLASIVPLSLADLTVQ